MQVHVTRAGFAQRFRSVLLKREMRWAVSPLALLFGFWILLFGPYLLFGGFVRDDLGFLTQPRGTERYMGWLDQPRGFENYAEFELFVASFPTMTGRPVSAILHGLCYWFFATTIWPYHMINLGLFFASVVLVYGAVKNVTSREIAFLTALFALIYPSASGTIFSSIMMNSNLAAVFWSIALYLDSTRKEHESNWKDFAVVVALLLSSLSYEAFIPLFMVNILIRLVRIVKRNGIKLDLRQLLKDCAPILTAWLLFAAYRGFAERILFENAVSTISAPSLTVLVSRFFQAIALGMKESFVQSLKISVKSLNNLRLLSWPYLLMVFASLAVSSFCISSCVGSNSNLSRRWSTLEGTTNTCRITRIKISPWLYVFSLAILIYVASLFIFVFSSYIPNSLGFESRTQGAVRFAVAFLIAVAAKSFYNLLNHSQLKRIVVLGTIVLFVLFTFSIVGQREAWISAAQYNNALLQKMDGAIRRAKLNEQAAFTFVAELPGTFPNQVNAEPIFGEAWDLGPALSSLYPLSNVRANVYEPFGTTIQQDQVIVGGYWAATYPFYFYRFSDDQIYFINTAEDLSRLIAQRILK